MQAVIHELCRAAGSGDGGGRSSLYSYPDLLAVTSLGNHDKTSAELANSGTKFGMESVFANTGKKCPADSSNSNKSFRGARSIDGNHQSQYSPTQLLE
ncbi:hypothetical protein CSAL01_03494 [Colletotrichum salicis]|uniref:Uncharacterized protein n=1 Tax=Colletotrichum salicis TaxID=1209931 RepID=A0A135T508_9PEZI|nr:hypothetical protein CSAL01_03494 [Colletotrichum salicis]